jgi:hypothetical protein
LTFFSTTEIEEEEEESVGRQAAAGRKTRSCKKQEHKGK